MAADKAKDAAGFDPPSPAPSPGAAGDRQNYRTIGEWFVSEYEGEIPTPRVRDLVEAVNTSKAKIAELEASNPVRTMALRLGQRLPPRRSAPSAARL